MASRSGSSEDSSTRYCNLSFSTAAICGSRVSGCSRTPVTSASGSAASTSAAPVTGSSLTSLLVSASSELSASSESPLAENETGPVVSESSAGMDSSGFHSSWASPRTMRSRLPSGCGASAALTVRLVSAIQSRKPGFSTSLTSFPVTRSSR